jgi:hypothetical protein
MQPNTAIAMNNTSQFLRCLRLLAAALILTATLSSGLAQGSKSARPLDHPVVAPVPVKQPSPPAYNLKIAEPTSLEDVVDVLREQYPDANFVLAPGLGRSIVIDDLKIRHLNVSDALSAIRIASGSRFEWRANDKAYRIDPATGLPVENSPTADLYFLTAAQSAKPKVQIEAFNLSHYLASIKSGSTNSNSEDRIAREVSKIQDLVLNTLEHYRAYLREELQTEKPLKDPSLQFHSGANLFVVMGEPEVVMVVAKIINALPGVQPATIQRNLYGYSADPFSQAAAIYAQPPQAGMMPGLEELPAILPPPPTGAAVYSQPTRARKVQPAAGSAPAAQH